MANTEQKPEKELKQVNFRIDPDTANAFREFCTLNGMNQAQGFDHIMQVLELNSAKTVSAGRAVEIEDFEQHAKALLSSYLKSLELCDRAETRARERFDGELKQNARAIADLKRQNEELRASLVKSQAEQAEAEKRNEEYKDRLLYSDRALAEQKQSMQILKEQVENQKQIQAELTALRSEKEGLAARASAAISQAERLNEEITALRKEKNGADAALEKREADVLRLTDEAEHLKKALAKAEGEKTAADSLLKSMEANKKNEMEQAALQAQLEKERAVAAKEKELREEMMALKQESMRLSIELDYIKQHGNHQAVR